MNVYIPLALILALICAFSQSSNKRAQYAFVLSMFATFIFAAVRYQFGPDYDSYWNIFYNIKGSDVSNYTGTGSSAETWFLHFIELFPTYTAFIVCSTFLWFGVNFLFLNKYLYKQQSWIFILYFFFNSTYFSLSLVAMRSAMAAYIFLAAFMFLIKGGKRNQLIYVLLVLIASQFHTSTLPFVILVFLNNKNRSIVFSKWIITGVAAIALVSILLGHNYIVEYLGNKLIDSVDSLSKYSEGQGTSLGVVGSSLNSIIFLGMSTFIAFYLSQAGFKESDPRFVYIYKVAVLASLIQMLLGQSLISDRFFLYLNPIYITAFIHSQRSSNRQYFYATMLLIFVISLYIFASKMGQDYSISFRTYQTIFSAPYIP